LIHQPALIHIAAEALQLPGQGHITLHNGAKKQIDICHLLLQQELISIVLVPGTSFILGLF
jgi:hypothetical protein